MRVAGPARFAASVFLHNNWPGRRIQLNRIIDDHDATISLPVLDDANSTRIANHATYASHLLRY